jgi:hypothetical protein
MPLCKSMQASTGKPESPYCVRWGLHTLGENLATHTVPMRPGESSAEAWIEANRQQVDQWLKAPREAAQ